MAKRRFDEEHHPFGPAVARLINEFADAARHRS